MSEQWAEIQPGSIEDLAEALSTPEGQADPAGMLRSWARVVRGEVDENTAYRPTPIEPGPQDIRRAWALQTIRERGAIRSGELARAFGIASETARLDLAHMVEAGTIRRNGERRLTVYTLGA